MIWARAGQCLLYIGRCNCAATVSEPESVTVTGPGPRQRTLESVLQFAYHDDSDCVRPATSSIRVIKLLGRGHGHGDRPYVLRLQIKSEPKNVVFCWYK